MAALLHLPFPQRNRKKKQDRIHFSFNRHLFKPYVLSRNRSELLQEMLQQKYFSCVLRKNTHD
ncbi:MAG: hypothetical protein WC595_03515 [Candidatus Nanoarchaeia archaeon]